MSLTIPDDPLYNVEEAAAYTRRCTATIRRAAKRRDIACIRLGERGKYFFRLSHLDAWLDSLSVHAAVDATN
jgi:hypothetical protein